MQAEAEVDAREAGGGSADGAQRRPKAVIIGPLPPPYQGMAIFTRQLLGSEVLGRSYELLHLDTADRRTAENMGRFDLTNVVLALRHAAELLRILIRNRPEITYVEVSQNALAYLRDSVFIYLAHLSGSRVVAHLHGSYFREFYEGAGWWCRWLIRSTSKRLAAAAVLGDGLRGIYEGLVPEDRIHAVPNGIPDPFGEAGAVERVAGDGGESEPLTVLYLGMLFEPKGFLDLLRAAGDFRGGEPRVRFVFAGEWFSDAERREAERVAAEAGLNESDLSFAGADGLERFDGTLRGDRLATFVGRVDGESKWDLIAGADIFVFPGWQPEGMPLVILEAMAAGLPVVTTDTGAIGDVVVDGETGLIVGKRDPAGLSAAIRRLAESDGLRHDLGRAGRARYLAEYTEDRCTGRLVELFDLVRKG